MRIIAYVCSDLYDRTHTRVHRIRRTDLGVLADAPDWIAEDPMFRLLVKDGSVKVAESRAAEKVLENNPMAGINAEGREIALAADNEPTPGDKAAKPRAGKSKAEEEPKAEKK